MTNRWFDPCSWGFHDWETVKVVSEDDVHNLVYGTGLRREGLVMIYAKKICLRCGLKRDAITPRINEMQKDRERSLQRANLAKRLWSA